jgi:hypothetical protein
MKTLVNIFIKFGICCFLSVAYASPEQPVTGKLQKKSENDTKSLMNLRKSVADNNRCYSTVDDFDIQTSTATTTATTSTITKMPGTFFG